MMTVGRRRGILVIAVSAAAHVAVFGLLALVRPELRQAATPPAVFDVEITPRLVPSPARAEAAPSRPLRIRRPAARPSPAEVPPLIVPEAAMEPAGRDEPPVETAPSAPATLRDALRRSPVGCANPSLLAKEERDACLERLGAGAKDAPFIQPPMDPDKRREFDQKSAAQEQMRIYRETGVYPGLREALKAAK